MAKDARVNQPKQENHCVNEVMWHTMHNQNSVLMWGAVPFEIICKINSRKYSCKGYSIFKRGKVRDWIFWGGTYYCNFLFFLTTYILNSILHLNHIVIPPPPHPHFKLFNTPTHTLQFISQFSHQLWKWNSPYAEFTLDESNKVEMDM